MTQSVLANLVATLVLSALMLMKSTMGLMPELDVIAMLSAMMHRPAMTDWAAHLMIGSIVFGVAFAAAHRFLPGKTSIAKGIAFGVVAWFMMMVAVMPMAGAGVFGLGLGVMAPVMTLMLHIIYGLVLDLVFGRLTSSPTPAPAH